MAQVYAIIHDGAGNFIIAWKNPCSYFFHNTGGGGTIYPDGSGIHDPDNWAFPGGGMKGGVVPGALTELKEETNVVLDPALAQPAYHTGKGYYGVYFNVSEDFDSVYDLIAGNLAIGVNAVQAITAKGSKYTEDKYDLLMKDFPGCPADNELFSVKIWNLLTDAQKISDLNTEGTEWYYAILMKLLQQTQFPVTIQDENGNVVGAGIPVAGSPVAGSPVDILPGDQGYQFIIPNFQYDAAKLLQQGSYTLVYEKENYTVTVVSLAAPGNTSIFTGDEADTQ